MNTYQLKLDLNKGPTHHLMSQFGGVTIRQGDKNGTTISADLYDHGTALDTSGLSAYFVMPLPDREHYYRKAASLSNSTVSVVVDETEAASVVGKTDNAYFELLQGNTVIASTQSFHVTILRDALAGKEPGETYDTEIQEAIDNLNEAVEHIADTVEEVLEDHPEWTTTIQDGAVTPAKLSNNAFPDLTAGASEGVTGGGPSDTAAWLQRTCPGTNGPAKVESIHGRTLVWNQLADAYTSTTHPLPAGSTVVNPEPYYPYDAGSLLSVQITGIETVGFNLWDEQWEVGGYSVSNGTTWNTTDRIRSKVDNYIPVLPDTEYCITRASAVNVTLCYYDADKTFISGVNISVQAQRFTTPANARYLRFAMYPGYGTTYNHDICINLSSSRNGEYEPHWSRLRPIPAATYFPNGMRSAGSVYDELTESAAVTRVGSVVLDGSEPSNAISMLNTANANLKAFNIKRSYITNMVANAANVENVICDKLPTSTTAYNAITTPGVRIWSDSSAGLIVAPAEGVLSVDDFKTWLQSNNLTVHYALATPTTTTIEPPLNLTYKAASGGTERITHTEPTAPPTMEVTYGSTAEGIVASALAAIADPDGPTATATHAVGTYLTMGGKLYRVTTAIAIGESITPGTNVTATTVMAEVLSLVQ